MKLIWAQISYDNYMYCLCATYLVGEISKLKNTISLSGKIWQDISLTEKHAQAAGYFHQYNFHGSPHVAVVSWTSVALRIYYCLKASEWFPRSEDWWLLTLERGDQPWWGHWIMWLRCWGATSGVSCVTPMAATPNIGATSLSVLRMSSSQRNHSSAYSISLASQRCRVTWGCISFHVEIAGASRISSVGKNWRNQSISRMTVSLSNAMFLSPLWENAVTIGPSFLKILDLVNRQSLVWNSLLFCHRSVLAWS